MANMSYCRFENTLDDLKDCYRHVWDDDLSAREERARAELIKLCRLVADRGEGEFAE
jgi:hypothetical protein